MNSLNLCSSSSSSSSAAAIFSKVSHLMKRRTSSYGFSCSSWKSNTKYTGIRIKPIEFDFMLTRFRVHCYSSARSARRRASPSPLSASILEQEKEKEKEKEKNPFYVVRKGDFVGVYSSLDDCQAQVGSSVCHPPVSVFKGYSLRKEAEEYLVLHGFKNAIYSISAMNVEEDLFGPLVPCPFQQPVSSIGKESKIDSPQKKLQEVLKSEGNALSCTLQFDGASKGNPGQAGAGVVLRAADGSVVYQLREGLGMATNNVAEYRALLLGLKYALKKGFKQITVQGDSKLVCLQVQGLWRARNKNTIDYCKEAKELRDQFLSFQINHVLRAFNSEADAQANLARKLEEGQIEEDCEKVA